MFRNPMKLFDYYDRFDNVFKQYSMKLMMTHQCFLIQLSLRVYKMNLNDK